MMKIVSVLLCGIQALPLLTDTYNSAKFDSSTASGYGCQMCIRNGWVYATTQDWFSLIPSGSDYIGDCCQTLGPDCANAYDAAAANKLKSGYRASSLDFTSRDLAIAACPTKVDLCGPVRELNITHAMSLSDNNWKANLGFQGDWTTKDSCTYLVKQEQNGPVIKFAESKNKDNDVMFHYVEWSDHGNPSFTKDPNYSPWPPISTSLPNVLDDQDTKYPDLMQPYDGQYILPNFKSEVGQLIPGNIIYEWMQPFSKKHTEYKIARQLYEDSIKYYKIRCDEEKFKILDPYKTVFYGFHFSHLEENFNFVDYPSQPVNYTGPIPDETEVDFGYGSLSAGTMKMPNSDEAKLFGTLGLWKDLYKTTSGGVKIPTAPNLDLSKSEYYDSNMEQQSMVRHNFTADILHNNYVAITILPNSANSDTSKKALIQVSASIGPTRNMTVEQYYNPIDEFDFNTYRKKVYEDAGLRDFFYPTYRIYDNGYFYKTPKN